MRVVLARLLSVAITLITQAALAAEPADEPATLKQWAVARCVAKAYGGTQAGRDADATAGLYVEQARSNPELFVALDALVDAQLAQQAVLPMDEKVQDVPLLNCLGLYDSKALDEMIRAYMTQQVG